METKLYEASCQDPGELKRDQHALWEADRGAWQETHPFLYDLVAALTLVPVIDDSLPTAATDGRSLFFNARFSTGLTTVTRRFLQAHLVWHCVTGHLLPRQDKDLHRWHLACDHEVNSLLVHQGFFLPDKAVLFFSQFGRSAEAVYGWLVDHPAPHLEQPLDLYPTDIATLAPTAVRDKAFAPVTPDKALVNAWRTWARLVARDYRCTPFLPEAVDATLRTLALRY